MAKRVVGDPCIVPINFRVTEKMKTELDSAADFQGISTTEYIRRAIQEKLDRERAEKSTENDTLNAILRRLEALENSNSGPIQMQTNTRNSTQICKTGKK